jgi:flagellar motor switch protein FliM
MKTHVIRTSLRPAAPAALQVLDPRTLGRPMHLLGGFTTQLRTALSESFRTGLNRRYGAGYEVDDVRVARQAGPIGPGRWFACATSVGRITLSMDRPLLLSVLDYRYGTPVHASADAEAAAAVRETATEERLAATLCARWTETLLACIGRQQDVELTASPSAPPARGGWTIEVGLSDSVRQVAGVVSFALDDSAMGQVLRSIAPARECAKPKPGAASPSAAGRLPLVLTGRLVEKQLALGDVLDLRPGAIIPVSLGLADVLVDDSRLFTAAVTEHKGKLCLTSFDDAE